MVEPDFIIADSKKTIFALKTAKGFKPQKEQQAKQENCDIAQSRLKSLEDGGRIIKPSGTGEREYMSSDEIEAEKIPARKKAEEACKK